MLLRKYLTLDQVTPLITIQLNDDLLYNLDVGIVKL